LDIWISNIKFGNLDLNLEIWFSNIKFGNLDLKHQFWKFGSQFGNLDLNIKFGNLDINLEIWISNIKFGNLVLNMEIWISVWKFGSQTSNHSAELMNPPRLTFALFCTPSWLHITYLNRSIFKAFCIPLSGNAERALSIGDNYYFPYPCKFTFRDNFFTV